MPPVEPGLNFPYVVIIKIRKKLQSSNEVRLNIAQ